LLLSGGRGKKIRRSEDQKIRRQHARFDGAALRAARPETVRVKTSRIFF
jgi:hypothetical protein